MTVSILNLLRGRGDGVVYARAVPERTELTETYWVKQEISRNRSIERDRDPTGRIEISIPYDGYEHFTRQAVRDVEKALESSDNAGQRQATVGHLLLANHRKVTGLPSTARHHTPASAIPLTVPVDAHGGGLDLTGDRRTCVIAYDYRPKQPPIFPVHLSVKVHDLDSLTDELDSVSGAEEDLDREEVRNAAVDRLKARWYGNPSQVIDNLRRNVHFSSELLLSFALSVAVPVDPSYRNLHPEVRNMSVKWPTLTSLRSTKLFVENFGQPNLPMLPKVVRYNPKKGRLEWNDVPVRYLRPDGSGQDADTRIFHSAVAVLRVGHPGDLLKEDTLEVTAQVEIPDYLMSGLQARLYDATGYPQTRQPELSTTLNIRAVVYLGDIFAGRAFSPYQQFVFDDIIPDDIRIHDICRVLRNAGFVVEEPLPQAHQDELAPRWLLLARRSQGPDDLELRLVVEGMRTLLSREQIMNTSTRIKGSKESGRIKISVLGTLHRDHKELTRVMNALQQELRERFRFHQTSRK